MYVVYKCEIILGFLVMHKILLRMHNRFRVFLWQVLMGNQIEGIILLF